MRDREVDFNLSFENQAATQSMVSETFRDAEPSDDIYQANGRLNAIALVRNAKILLASGDIPLAKNIFRALVEHGEMLGVAYAGLGGCYDLEGKTDLSIKAYRESIIYDPTYGSLFALAELYVKKEEYQNAVGTLLRANNLSKLTSEQFFEIHKCLGSCYVKMGQLNNAEAHYRKAFDLFPQSDALHVNIGSLAMKKGDQSTALLHFKEAIRINPKNSEALTGSGLAHTGMGNKDLAHEAFANALRVNIHEVTALYYLVRCAYELKSFDTACDLLRKYIEHNPVNSNILYSYAGMLYHRKMYGEALEECDKLLELSAEHEGAKRLREMILKKS